MRLLLTGSTVLTLTLCGCATQSQVAAERQRSLAPVARPTASSSSEAASTPPLSMSPPLSPAASLLPSAPMPSTQPADTIPWLDLPGEHLDPTPLPTRSPTDIARACRADQLVVVSVGPPGDTADDGAIVDLRNASRQTCLLTGAVHATLYGPQAPPVSLTGSGGVDHWESHDMAPGGVTSVWFTANGVCMSGPAHGLDAIPVTEARLQIPGGGSVLVRGLNMPRTCHGPAVSGFYQRPVDPAYPPQPLEGARIDIVAATTVTARSTLHYVVTVTNPTDTPITMQPCPSYHQFLSPYPDKRFYRLNCDGHTELAPYQTLRFAMQLAVPPQEANGPEKLIWQLDTAVTGHPPVRVEVVGSTATTTTPPVLPPPSVQRSG